jgi:bifunctional non-homologous end joining protein LigD
MVLDGEVIVFNEQGIPDFDALQLYNGHNSPITYYVFDLLWLDGYDIKSLPLTERKKKLADLIDRNDIIKVSESFNDGLQLYHQAVDMKLEGIEAKKRTALITKEKGPNSWLRTPTRKREKRNANVK